MTAVQAKWDVNIKAGVHFLYLYHLQVIEWVLYY